MLVKMINDFKQRLKELDRSLNMEEKEKRLAFLNQKMNEEDFWTDQACVRDVVSEVKGIKELLDKYNSLMQKTDDCECLLQLASELNDTDAFSDAENELKEIEPMLNAFEVKTLLSGEYDKDDAILEIHPGAGGTESQDWCFMLYRMYKMYLEKKGFKYEILDYQAGDEAGIKNVAFLVSANYAYGYLKAEHGVHRLVRISPFDASKRRHTSFCAVHVTPKLTDDINIEINQEDIRIDTYRSSGAGGQYVNTTDSAVRITHLKTGIVVTCQNERSQIQNKEKAMAILKSKLYRAELLAKEKKLQAISGATGENSFGSQIRSYVFHPYNLVKDHRTNYEKGDIQAVMNGDIDEFIDSYLKSKYNLG